MPIKVAVIGAAIMDLMGIPQDRIIFKDSVPGHLKMAPGGVGRNVAENLARLKIPTQLITVFAEDSFGQMLREHALKVGIEISQSLILSNAGSALHLAILDEQKDLAAGIACLDLLAALQPGILETKIAALQQQKIVVIETNIPQNSIEFLVKHLTKPMLFLDPVSIPLSEKVIGLLSHFHTVKANQMEASALTGIVLNQRSDLSHVATKLHRSGIENVFITLGKEGVYYSNSMEAGQMSMPIANPLVNSTGAGDAFMAGIVYGTLKNWSIRDCARSGMAAAQIAIQYEEAVNPLMAAMELEKGILKFM